MLFNTKTSNLIQIEPTKQQILDYNGKCTESSFKLNIDSLDKISLILSEEVKLLENKLEPILNKFDCLGNANETPVQDILLKSPLECYIIEKTNLLNDIVNRIKFINERCAF